MHLDKQTRNTHFKDDPVLVTLVQLRIETNFHMSVRPSARMEQIGSYLGGFSCNFMLETSIKICRQIQIGQKYRAFYNKTEMGLYKAIVDSDMRRSTVQIRA
jgi:hypothetical protein